MTNNSEGIMARYKKYLTNQQKKKLRSLYAGYQQTTADERREAYLQARKAADRSAAAASSMGLGGGYEARKQAATNADLDKYGFQLNRQADAAFESNAVVPMANQTIKARNEAARKAYERKKKAAYQAYLNALKNANQPKQQTPRLTKKERDELKYYRYGQQYMVDALMPGITAHQDAQSPRRQPIPVKIPVSIPIIVNGQQYMGDALTPTTNPRNNTHNRDKAYQYAQEWVDEAGATRPQTKRDRGRAKANRYAQDWAGNAPKESPLKKNNGSAVNPKFDISPKQPVVLPPEYAKEVEARVKDIAPNDVPQVKLDYLNEVNQYASLLQGLNEAYKPVGKMQDLANQYQQLVRDISDPTLSVAQRKQASVLAQQLEQDYREAYNSFNANKAGLQYLQNRVERAYGTLQIDRAVLSRLGVEMTEDDIGFNTGWAKTHGYIPETPEELFIATRDLIDNENETTDEFWKRAKNNSAVLFGYGDEAGNYKNALGESTIPEEERKLVLDSQDEAWMRDNGFGWVIDGVAQMLENSNQYATFAQAAKAFLEQKEADEWQYFEERNVRRVLNRFNEIDDSEKNTAMSEGAKQTGIDLDRWDDIHTRWEGVSNYKFETDEDGRVRAVWKKTGNVLKDNAINRNAGNYVGGNIAAGQIEKKLGLPSRYLNTNTLAIMTKEDAAFINYCYGMGDKETARQYIYQLAELANQLVGKEKADKIAELPWGIRFAREAMDQFSYGVSSFHTGLADVFTNHRTPTTVKEVKSSAITENQRERGWGGAADVINPALVSAGNMAPSIALGYAGGAAAAALSNTAAGASTLGVLATEGLSHAGTISMGLSAGGKAKQEALRMGYGKDAANVYGIINGISETCLQEIMGGVVTLGQPQWLQTLGDSILNSVKNPVARVMIRQALNAASETTEEVMQDILDPVFKGVSLNEKYLNDHPEAKQLLNTALSTVISTLLMNGLGGDILNTAKTETAVQRLSESYGLSVADARFMLNTYSDLMNREGGNLDIEDYNKFNELASVIESNLPASVIDKIQKGETDLISYGASQYGAVSGKLDRKLTKAERTATQTEAVDHTEALKSKTDEQRRDYLLNAAPTGKVGNAYYTTTNGKAIEFKNLDATQKANYILAQKCAKAFEGSVDVVIHDTLPLSNGAMVGSDGKLHIALDVTNAQGRESIAYWTLAHEAGHALKIADSKAWNEMFGILTDYAKNHKDRDGKSLYDALVDSITNQYKYDNNSDAFNDEMFSLIAERMVGSEGEQWAATLGDNTIFDAIANDRNASAKAKKGFLGKLKASVEKLSRQFRDGGFSKERKHLAKIREQLTEAYERINEGETVKEKYAEQKQKAAAPAKTNEQDKLAAEETENTRFQMKAPVETTDRLIAWHNMSEDALRSALELGGLAMPSWAIKTADKAHTSYGDISVIAPRALVDPKQNRNSMIFGGDAWTPVFPNVDYKISRDAAEALEDEIGNLIGDDLLRELGGAALDTDNIANQFNRNGGTVSSYYKNNVALRYAFLKSIGQEVEIPKRSETLDSTGELQNGAIVRFANNLVNGKSSLQPYLEMPGTELMKQDDLLEAVSHAILSEYEETLPPKIYKDLAKVYSPSEIKYSKVDHMIRAAKKYFERGIKQVADKNALIKRIDEAIDEAAYEKWIGDKLKATIERKGIRNNKDMFTPSGNRRSFDALHYEYNLANIVKAMKSQPKQGRTQFLSSPGSVKGAALKSYNTVEQVRADRGRLVNTAEEADAAYKEYSKNLESILDRMGKDRFSSADALIEVLQHAKTEDGIYRYMERELKDWYNVSKDIAHDIYKLIGEINALPMEYFEGKTYDAVTFGETAAVVVPDTTSEELKQQLSNAGANVVEYKAGDNEDRLEKVNSVEGVRFQNRATDTEYLSLAEKYRDGTASGEDIDVLNKAVEEAAKANGYKKKVYHGTRGERFNIFDFSKDQRGNRQMFFSSNRKIAETYGHRVMSLFINADNFLTVDANGDWWTGFEDKITKDKAQAVLDQTKAALQSAYYDAIDRQSHAEYGSEEYIKASREASEAWDKWNEMRGQLEPFDDEYISGTTYSVANKAREMGYAGLIIKRVVDTADTSIDMPSTVYVIFDSNRVKSADPVTYDDNGDIIPLSERFNAENEDIRYQQRDFRIDFNVPQLDTKALHEAVKGGEGTVENRFEVKYEKTDAGFAVHITDKDSGKTYDRAETVTEGNAKAEAERAAAAVIRNIKKGRANSNNTSTSDIYIEKGEIPARDVNVPKSARQGMKTSKLARTIAEAPGMTDESVDELMNKVYRGFMSYKPDVNQESMDKALKKIEDNPAAATTEWNKVANSGKILTPDDVALGSALMVSASQSGDVNSAMEIASQLQDLATTGGKLVQSFRMIKRLGAAGEFYYINRQVAKINAELEKQAKGYKLTLNEELVQNLLNARDYHDIREATEALRKDLGQQLKPTLRDWLTAWRYTAMLGNAKTLVRNDIGNAAYVPVIMMDNVLNAIGQTVTSAVSKGKFEKTTKLFAGKEYRDFANWDWKDTVKYDIKGNKYSEGQLGDIKDYMRYDTHAKGILKPGAWVFEKWRSGTQKFMEDEALMGDMAFKKLHYQHALATRLDQLKVDVKALQDVLTRSRNNETFEKGTREAKLLAVYEAAAQYAVSEANRNTYNDVNTFASFVSQMSRTMYEKQNKKGRHTLRAGHYALEGLLPFKNTPANIVARAAEHSPIGLAKTLTLDLGRVIKGAIAEQQFAKGKISKQKYENLIASSISGEQFIHNLSAGLTGSALFALGAILAKAGILHGGLGYDDKDDKEKKRRGHQSYSLEIGNVSITLDWLAPECIPLFMGVELFEQLGGMSAEDWSEKWLKALLNVTTGAFEPMLNMSMLSGINALFEGFTSTDDLQGIGKVVATVATSYITQFQPTILGQFARTIDPTRRTTYYDKNAKIPPFMQKFWQTALKKIPGATFLLQPYVDEFGNTSKTFEKYGSGAFWLNMAEQFFSPAYRSKLSNTEVDQEIERLGEDAYPSRANKYINFDKQKYNLTADEYTAYATLRGETAYALVQNMIGTDAYNALSDAEKVAAFKDAYTYADTIAKSTILGMRGVIGADPGALESWVGKANAYAKAVGTPDAISQFIAVKQGLKVNGITNRDDRAQFLWQQDIPAENKALLMEMNDGSNGGYAEGTAFYNKKGELVVDFGGERPAVDTAPATESEAATEVPSSAEVPAVEDKYAEATNTVKKMNAEESTAYLNTTSFTSEEKYQILANADKNDPRAKNAEAFHATYGLSYDDMWDVHTKYNSETFHGYDFQKYVDGKKGLKGRQKFALVELANTQSAWLEKAQSINSKMGISYDTLWKIKLYWSGESGQGKKARITAYCKSLGLRQSQIDKLYNEYKFLS